MTAVIAPEGVRQEDFERVHTYGGVAFGPSLSTGATMPGRLAARARARGDDPFLTTFSEKGEEHTLSYREFDLLSRQVGAWIARTVGVGAGDVAALLPANDALSIAALFALQRSGCAVLLLNPGDPPDRLRQQTGRLTAKAVLRSPSVADTVLTEAVELPTAPHSRTDAAAAHPTSAPLDPWSDALFFGTSGSTAAAKLVAQSHYNAAANADALVRHHALRPGDRLLGCLPVHHVNGLHFTVFGTLTAGAHLVLAREFDPFGYPELVERFRPRMASVVPSILETMLAVRQPTLPSTFDYFVTAAAPLTAATARAMARQVGARVLQGYGLTETTNFSTTMPADLPEDTYRRMMLDTDIPSIGTPFPGNDVAVLTDRGDRAAPGETGEICMRGTNVMTRYAGNPEATARAFAGGWFHSGDTGFHHVDAETGRTFLVITGRRKNIAKVRGESVSLDEMDRVLRSVPLVVDAAAVAVPHRFLGEEIVAAVVLAPGTSDVDLRPALSAVFSPAVHPSRVARLEAIPRTRTGKVLRPELTRQLMGSGPDTQP
ncbi:AMP-binding protein [Streptomyces fagopyri]|uniref:AMP-binding protein n=1 Tax=Streptomyces fagopyri TaxID=2662397 RepID=A0A5Q0L6K3_9ACTN|nr:class I adenylate-forming enzyme family protein [Streptomyces fagopyri]QFZ72336.1 AMP-binding protein [Streptomyces fagopyri]